MDEHWLKDLSMVCCSSPPPRYNKSFLGGTGNHKTSKLLRKNKSRHEKKMSEYVLEEMGDTLIYK